MTPKSPKEKTDTCQMYKLERNMTFPGLWGKMVWMRQEAGDQLECWNRRSQKDDRPELGSCREVGEEGIQKYYRSTEFGDTFRMPTPLDCSRILINSGLNDTDIFYFTNKKVGGTQSKVCSTTQLCCRKTQIHSSMY